ncbi:MAG: hypothetical protein IPM94_13965 [bacterium]|nr:hypothetical protein [bacterium]
MNKRRVPVLLALALLLAVLSPPPARAAGPFRSKTCLECHADQKKAAGAPHAHAPSPRPSARPATRSTASWDAWR